MSVRLAAEEGAAWGCVPWSTRNGTVQGLNKPPRYELSLHGTKRRVNLEELALEVLQAEPRKEVMPQIPSPCRGGCAAGIPLPLSRASLQHLV